MSRYTSDRKLGHLPFSRALTTCCILCMRGSSETLDLRERSNYRNLSRPIGAQKDSRMHYFRKKYKEALKTFASAGVESVCNPIPRHYSTHYSNPQIVLWYLLRLDPFTSAHLHLQDGVFDLPDRQFDSIEVCELGAWVWVAGSRSVRRLCSLWCSRMDGRAVDDHLARTALCPRVGCIFVVVVVVNFEKITNISVLILQGSMAKLQPTRSRCERTHSRYARGSL